MPVLKSDSPDLMLFRRNATRKINFDIFYTKYREIFAIPSSRLNQANENEHIFRHRESYKYKNW